MIIKFPHHKYRNGTSTGSNQIRSAVAYLMSDEERNHKPELVKGDKDFIIDVVDSIDNKHKYTSLVICFRQDEKPTHKKQMEIIERFEAAAFAGLDQEEYTCLWVRHEDKGRTELHCLTPRINLANGLALNIKPPGQFSLDLMDSFRDLIINPAIK